MFAWLERKRLGRRQQRIQEILSESDLALSWPAIRETWKRAKYVYRGPHSYGAIIELEYELFCNMAAKHPDQVESVLRNGLCDSNAMVAAYCMMGLEALGAPFSAEPFSGREDPIEWLGGCRRGKETLASFAELTSTDPMVAPPR